jgi:hypothetical protein
MTMRIWRTFASVALLAAAVPAAAQQVSLKDTQKAIRERVLSEAGSDSLLYSRIDFNDCAVTIQTRTPRAATGAETRTTVTFHATSVDPVVAAPAPEVVRLNSAAGAAFRRMVQRVDSGVVRERMDADSALEIRFAQPGTAATVARAFRRLVIACVEANPFKSGGR